MRSYTENCTPKSSATPLNVDETPTLESYSYEVEYQCFVFIKEYVKAPSLLFLALTTFLNTYDPRRSTPPSIDTMAIDDQKTDVLIQIKFNETHRFIECDIDEAEGMLDGKTIKLDRSKPEAMMPLLSITPVELRTKWELEQDAP